MSTRCLSRLLHITLHTGRDGYLAQRALALDKRQRSCTHRLEVHDDRTTQLIGVIGEKRLHAIMAGKLATKRNEPDFRRNLGVMEMVDALLVFFGLHWLRHHVRRHDFLFGANVCIAHRDAREGASVPTAAAATARAIVRRRLKSGRLVLVEAVVLVVVIVVVLVLRIFPVAGPGINIGLVRRRIVAEAFPTASVSPHGASIEGVVDVEPFLRRHRNVFLLLLAAEAVEELSNARLWHLHISRARECPCLGDSAVVRRIIRVIDIDVFVGDVLEKLLIDRGERACRACRCKRSNLVDRDRRVSGRFLGSFALLRCLHRLFKRD